VSLPGLRPLVGVICSCCRCIVPASCIVYTVVATSHIQLHNYTNCLVTVPTHINASRCARTSTTCTCGRGGRTLPNDAHTLWPFLRSFYTKKTCVLKSINVFMALVFIAQCLSLYCTVEDGKCIYCATTHQVRKRTCTEYSIEECECIHFILRDHWCLLHNSGSMAGVSKPNNESIRTICTQLQ
jgi:hypothetical protein